MLRRIAAILTLVFLPSCAVVPGKTHASAERRKREPTHYYNTPRTPDLTGSHLAGIPKLNPTWWNKNTDNPLPDWWRPEADEDTRRATWYLRNPMHNFTHYVIGVSDREFKRAGTYPPGVWNPDGKWNFTMIHAGPLIHLPFVSHRGKYFEKYIGWRNGGNFGMAFRRSQHPAENGTDATKKTDAAQKKP